MKKKNLLFATILIIGAISLTNCKKEPLLKIDSNSEVSFNAKKMAHSVVSVPKTGEAKQISDSVEIKKMKTIYRILKIIIPINSLKNN